MSFRLGIEFPWDWQAARRISRQSVDGLARFLSQAGQRAQRKRTPGGGAGRPQLAGEPVCGDGERRRVGAVRPAGRRGPSTSYLAWSAPVVKAGSQFWLSLPRALILVVAIGGGRADQQFLF